MNSPFASLQRRVAARLARPQRLFLGKAPIADWFAAHPGAAVELVVSARLSHELVCEPGLPLADDAALQAYARQLFGHYFGAAAKGWPLAPWFSGEQRGATALHGVDWPALRQQAAAQGVELRRAQPAWAPLLQRLAVEEPEWLRAPAAALAWVEGQVLTWLRLVDGQLQSLRQVRLAEATQTALGETLAELRSGGEAVLALGYGLDGGAVTPVWPGVRVLSRLDGESPELDWFAVPAEAPKTLPRPDFLGPRIERSRLAWPLAATGLLVLFTAAAGLQDSRQALADARERADGLRAAVSRVPRPPAVVASRAPAARSAELEQLRSAAEVQGLLQQGWEPMLSNIEQAGSAQLSWLALDYSAGRNELRLEGLTQDKLAALQVVDRLAAAPGWRNVVLSRFQTGEQGLPGQRFELSARLRADLLKPGLAPVPEAKP